MKTLDSLGNLFLDARDGVRRWGRAGGAVLVVAAGAPLAGGLALWSAAVEREAAQAALRVGEFKGFAVALFCVAGLLLLGGLRQAIAPLPPRGAERPPLDPAELLALAQAARRPFFVCIECRRLWTVVECPGRCPQCGSAADCLEVRSDSDLDMVRAAMP